MKPRKVVVTLEILSSRKIQSIKDDYLLPTMGDKVSQVQVNVVKQISKKATK
jgi:hypothetical protein